MDPRDIVIIVIIEWCIPVNDSGAGRRRKKRNKNNIVVLVIGRVLLKNIQTRAVSKRLYVIRSDYYRRALYVYKKNK